MQPDTCSPVFKSGDLAVHHFFPLPLGNFCHLHVKTFCDGHLVLVFIFLLLGIG